jgi:hypothetical protein
VLLAVGVSALGVAGCAAWQRTPPGGPGAEPEAKGTLTCTFVGRTALGERVGDGLRLVVENEAPFTVVFRDLETSRPRVRGNLGEFPLDVLRREPGTVWLAEAPAGGGINVWTVFLSTRVALLTKQYLVGRDRPLGLMAIGSCPDS